MSNSTVFLFVQQLWWSLPCNSSSLPPWRTPAACLEDPRGSPWEVSSPDLPLSLIIATCRAALQPRLGMKGCRKSLDCHFNNTHSHSRAPSPVVLLKKGRLETSCENNCVELVVSFGVLLPLYIFTFILHCLLSEMCEMCELHCYCYCNLQGLLG